MPAVSLRYAGVIAKVESVYGTDPTPVPATDGIRIVGTPHSRLRIEHAWMNTPDDDIPSGLLSSIPSAERIGLFATIDIPWRIRGIGGSYTATGPEAAPLLKACGLTESFGGGQATYSQADTGHLSCTIWVYTAKHLVKLVGCRGNVVWVTKVGESPIMNFRMMGMVSSITDLGTVPGIGIGAVVPAPSKALTVTIGGVALDITSLEIDLGADVQRLDGVGAADGITEFAIGGFKPKATFMLRTSALSTYNPYSDSDTPTARVIAITNGTVTGNKVALTNAASEALDPELVEDNIATAWRLPFRMRDFSIFFS